MSSAPRGWSRCGVIAIVVALLLGAAAGAWWFGPWNASARYNRMPLLALHRLADDRPQDRLVWHVLSLRLARDGDASLAEPALQHAFELNPKDSLVATVFARVLAGTGRSAESFQVLRQAEASAPASMAVKMDIGQFYQQKGALRRAAEEYLAVTGANPRNAAAWYRLAQCYFKMQKLGPAVDAMSRALTLQPNEPGFLMFDATLKSVRGKGDEAIAEVRRSAKLAPNDLLIQANLAEVLLQGRHTDQDLQEAEATIGRLEQMDPNFPPLSSLRGDLEADREHWDAAARFYVKTMEAMPDSDHAYFALARAYRHIGRNADAAKLEAIYRQRLALRERVSSLQSEAGADPKNAELFHRLASAERDLGHRAEAIEALQHALALAPHNSLFAKELAVLRQSAAPQARTQ